MGDSSIGVAVIGAGWLGGRTPAATGRRPTVFGEGLPEARLVAIADAHEPFAVDTARRYGYERRETSWQAIAEAADIDAVSVVVANKLHREIVEALLDAGKHVLCEKPLARRRPTGRRWPSAPRNRTGVASIGVHLPQVARDQRDPRADHRRPPRVSRALQRAPLVRLRVSPEAPMSWRYQGGPGSGALADIGTHLVDVSEFLCGRCAACTARWLKTVVGDRPVPLGMAIGHAAGVPVSDVRERVENEDIASFTATFADGATGTFSVSRIAYGMANALGFEVFCPAGAPRSTWPGRPSSRSPTPRRRGRPTGFCRFSLARRTPTSPRAADGLPRRRPRARTTSSPSRPARSSTRSPG